MRNTTRWFQGAVSAGIVVVLVVGVLFTLWRRPASSPTAQENPAPAAQAQTPEQITDPHPSTPTSYVVVVSPLPSPPPFPTPLPTPVVTRVPVAAPPFVAVPAEAASRPYTVFFRDGNLVKTIDSVDRAEEAVVDVYSQTSLYLGRRETWTTLWGAISPDGQRLALVLTDFEKIEDLGKSGAPGSREPHFFIYLHDLTTGELRLLVENAKLPVWSPDGGRLAFQNTKTRGLGVIDLATGAAEEIFSVEPGSEHQADWFTWSPDGKRMAVVKDWNSFANEGGIWIVEAEKEAEVRQIVEMEMNAGGLLWSPVGSQVLFSASQGERVTPEWGNNLWIVDVESGERKQLTQNIAIAGKVWSPDGKWIAFSGTNLLEGKDYQYDLWLLSSDGSTLQRLTEDPMSDHAPTWASNGAKLIFNKTDQGLWELDLLNGSEKQVGPSMTSYWFLK